MNGQPEPLADVFTVNPASLSSVQIESRQKGPPAITVKVYDAIPGEAARKARALYDDLVAAYADRTD